MEGQCEELVWVEVIVVMTAENRCDASRSTDISEKRTDSILRIEDCLEY
jgi:hypothetical protein